MLLERMVESWDETGGDVLLFAVLGPTEQLHKNTQFEARQIVVDFL